MRTSLAAFLFTLSSGIAAAQTAGKAHTAPEITPQDLKQRLYLIADDSMGGREPGSIGNFKTAEYIAAEFKRLGLKPAGESGYFQPVPFVKQQIDSHGVLQGDGVSLAQGSDYIAASWISARSGPLETAKAIYGGEAADSLSWIDSATAAGRFVVLGVSARNGSPRQYVRSGVARSPRWSSAAALSLGELDLLDPGVRRQVNEGTIRLATPGNDRQPPVLFLTPEAVQALFGASPETLQPGAAGKAVSGSVAGLATPTQYPARNVIAVLPGSDPKLRGQYLSLTAHNDHVGWGHDPVDHDSIRAFNRVVRPAGADSPNRPATEEEMGRIRIILDSLRAFRPARPDSIRNGADDDGTGTVALLELAEWFAKSKQRPKRSILFVSHTGEEYGLVGSAWFTDHPTVPRDSIVGEIDEDMIGRGDATDLPEGGPTYLEVVGAKRLSTEFGEQLEAANAAQTLPFVFNYSYDAPGHPLQYYCRADHYSYARYGIPSVALSRGEHLDYHQVTDEPQYIDYENLGRVVRMVRDAALRIGSMDHRPALDHPKGDPNTPCVQ